MKRLMLMPFALIALLACDSSSDTQTDNAPAPSGENANEAPASDGANGAPATGNSGSVDVPPQGNSAHGTAPSPAAVSESGKLTVDSPRAGQIVPQELKIRGSAAVYGNRVHVRITDGDDKTLVEEYGNTASTEVGMPGNFDITLSVPKGYEGDAIVMVMGHSAKDGSPEHQVKFPVTVKTTSPNTAPKADAK